MNEQELNRKLAEWAGWTKLSYIEPITKIEMQSYPDFTQSLDACFKWLVPKLHQVDIVQEFNQQAYARIVIQPELEYIECWEWAENPALALCLAVEKLIEGGN